MAQLNLSVLVRALICLKGLDLTWCLYPQPLSRAQELTYAQPWAFSPSLSYAV